MDNKILCIVVMILIKLVGCTPDLVVGAGGFGFGCGSNSPAAQIPYSFVRLGPDTTPFSRKLYFQFQHFGGYSNGDHGVRAFSHMHLVGAGVADLGVLGILPIPSSSKAPPIPKDPLVKFFKTTQYAEPGYYTSTIQGNIKVELTTTQRCGLHRYTFSNTSHDVMIMPSSLIQKKVERYSNIAKCGERCLEGNVTFQGSFGRRFGGTRIYFSMFWQSDTQDDTYIFNDTSISKTQQKANGNFSGAIIRTKSKSLNIYVGISYVSLKNARMNLEQEVGKSTFDEILKKAKAIWKEQLGRFKITAISSSLQTQIDTAIYRTLLSPTIFNDINGQYLSFANDGSIRQLPSHMKAVYTDMSLWDVHRTQMPWLLFQDLQRFNDIAMSLVLINREGGYMPKWPFAQGPTGCMIGSHANTILSDWIIKEASSYSNLNITEIYGYMLRNANTQTLHDSRPNPTEYIQRGYIAFEGEQRSSVSETLQLSYNDYSISQIAKLLNDNNNAKQMERRSKFYQNVWNNQTKFFDPKYKNGTFVKISNKQRVNIFSNYYVEGDAWHYRFYAPHDPQGLIKLFGGHMYLIKQLEKMFYRSKFWPTLWLPNPYYWAGNEHDLFSVWIFGQIGRSDLTQKYSRQIVFQSYNNNSAGLPGNDDYATMSAWLIFASLGFYPIPSTTNYVLGSPLVHQASIIRKLPDGKRVAFYINVKGNSIKKYRVDKVYVNGLLIEKLISHTTITKPNVVVQFMMK